MRRPGETLENLERVVVSRKSEPAERSYTSRLFSGGVPAIAAKVTEEAGELIEAAARLGDTAVASQLGFELDVPRVHPAGDLAIPVQQARRGQVGVTHKTLLAAGGDHRFGQRCIPGQQLRRQG